MQKKEINDRTLEKFANLWLRNMCKNIDAAADLFSVLRYKNTAGALPVCVIGAGPSLDRVLPFLSEIKKRCIIVCVDTALKACIRNGIQPHFIVLVDPQYWNTRHLDRISAPESILVTEFAAYPCVFRFKCKEIILCGSLYPLGKFIEQHTEPQGELGAGGSVATTAWDFARMLGTKNIIMAGLDLGFPENKTHFKGSTFEEQAHITSQRLHTAETDSFHALYDASPFYTKDYTGRSLLTDTRMSLYAWWFESKCASNRHITTCTISPQGYCIPGIRVESIENILKLPIQEKKIATVVYNKSMLSESECIKRKENYFAAVALAQNLLKEIHSLAESAISLTSEYCNLQKQDQTNKTTKRAEEILEQLTKIDTAILHNPAAELVALVFPNEEKINELTASERHPVEKSHIVYCEVAKSTKKHLQFFSHDFSL